MKAVEFVVFDNGNQPGMISFLLLIKFYSVSLSEIYGSPEAACGSAMKEYAQKGGLEGEARQRENTILHLIGLYESKEPINKYQTV